MNHPETLQELVDANHILANEGVFDAFGHVSVRSPSRADRFYLTRSLAPELVSPQDVLEHDLDGAVAGEIASALYVERYIHAAIYRARPDVSAVVHSHSPNLVPFGAVKRAALRPICHMCGFLGSGVPRFEIRDFAGPGTDLLVRDPELGDAVARTLGPHAMVLMRGHGSTVVGQTLKVTVYRAVYAEANARMQLSAERLGEVTFLSDEESLATVATGEGQVERPWSMWKARVRRAIEARGG